MALTAKDKNLLKIGGGVLAAIILYKIIAGKSDSSGAGYDATGNGSTTANTANFNATQIAAVLYDAMRYTGTDEAAIMNALKNINAAQLQQVITAFGSKYYNKTTGNTTEYLWNPISKHSLPVWLKNELSTADYKLLQLKFPTLLP